MSGRVRSDALRGLRVVLVDPHDVSRQALQRLLDAHGAVVRAARTSREALGALAGLMPNLVLVDVDHCSEDDLALVGAVAQVRDGRGVCAIFAVTGATYVRFRGRHFDGSVRKPVTSDRLLAMFASSQSDATMGDRSR